MENTKAKRNQPLGKLIKEGIEKVNTAIYMECCNGEKRTGTFIKMWIKFICFSLTHFSGPDDYFVNQLYRKSRFEIKKYITLGKMYKLRKIYNGNGDFEKFNDKTKFNKIFEKYILRDWIDVDNSSPEDLEKFIRKHHRFICKPKALGGGRGIHIYEVDAKVNITELYADKKGHILEEVIKQHHSIHDINPYCVNTMRITTIKEEGDVYIISAMFRCGTKQIPVDNWLQGGITAAVDIDTGIIFTKGVAKVPVRKEHMKHPVSGVVFPGFQMPYWAETVDMVKSMAGEVDDVRLIGWDVAITENGPCVVEGNHRSNTTILSVADNIGKYEVIKNIRKKYGKKL